MSLRDVVLEGARPVEIEVLSRLSADPTFHASSDVLRKLVAKGWVDSFDNAHVLTLTGRTLLDAR